MTNKNRFDLPRTISAQIKREIRQRCGFGCVICGFSWYDYEHFNPEYKDAKEHNPDGMTLLCMQCNQKKRRGVLSTETVINANKNPKCLQKGYSFEQLDLVSNDLYISIGGTHYINCEKLIQINDIPILSLNKSEENETLSISGVFYNSKGIKSLIIKENEWQALVDNWDVECIGNKITIRDDLGNISLMIRIEAPLKLIIERINMRYKKILLKGDGSVLKISMDNGKRWNSLANVSMSNCKVGIHLAYKVENIPLSSYLSTFLLKQ